MKDAGERLWIDITPILTNAFGRKGISFTSRLRLASFFLPLAGNVLLNLLAPDRRRKMILASIENLLAEIQAGIEAKEAAETSSGQLADMRARLSWRAKVLDEVAGKRLSGMVVLLVSGVASGMASLNLVNHLAKGALQQDGEAEEPGWQDSAWQGQVLEATRGLLYNPTMEMDLALWAVAGAIQSDAPPRAVFADSMLDELARRYQSGELPAAAQTALAGFLARYGARGLAEIDTGRERYRA